MSSSERERERERKGGRRDLCIYQYHEVVSYLKYMFAVPLSSFRRYIKNEEEVAMTLSRYIRHSAVV